MSVSLVGATGGVGAYERGRQQSTTFGHNVRVCRCGLGEVVVVCQREGVEPTNDTVKWALHLTVL